MKTGEIISIGSELLCGQTLDTNFAYLAQRLTALGINPCYHSTVGDEQKALATLIKLALKRSDIVITTGGLGPTLDDITLKAIAKVTHKRLFLQREILGNIQQHFNQRGMRMPLENIRQAYIPRGALWIKNLYGTAPGLIVKVNRKVLIALPGVPTELKPMTEDVVEPFLKKKFSLKPKIVSQILKTSGLAESEVNKRIKPIIEKKPKTVTLGIYAHPASVDLKISALTKNKKAMRSITRQIEHCLDDYIYAGQETSLEEVVGKLLTRKNKTLAVAESCTGGLLGNRITDVSGSSKYFKLGLTAYSNQAKINNLGVNPEKIKHFGAVSKEVALEMAKNVRALVQSDLGIGITGIAGPHGATATKPVGLTFISLAAAKKTKTCEFRFLGPRKEIKFKATQAALEILRRYLLKIKI